MRGYQSLALVLVLPQKTENIPSRLLAPRACVRGCMLQPSPTWQHRFAPPPPFRLYPLAAAAPVSSTVFVGNLSWGTTSDDLRVFMATLGEVVSAEVQSHADSGRSKGWG